jgi:hypothetical protein
VRTTLDVVFDEGRGWAWDKAVDDGSTPTYDFTVEYVHFEGAGGVGSSLPPSMCTPVSEPPPTSALRCPATTSAATRFSPPPPHPMPPCTPAVMTTPPARPLRHQLVSRTQLSSLLRFPTMRSASTRTTTASRCGIVRWRTFSATSRCRDWPLTIWIHSCILRATTASLDPSQRPRDTWHGVPRCSRR